MTVAVEEENVPPSNKANEAMDISKEREPSKEPLEKPETKEEAEEEEATTEESPEKKSDGLSEKKNETPEKPPPPPRPIKKARTAYFLFAEEKRPEFQAAHPGEGVGIIARLTGQAWSELSAEDKVPYQELAAQERERVAKELEEYKAKYGDVALPQQQSSQTDLVMPVARIRKICKLDPEVKGMSKEATLLITKCTEMALIKLGQESVKVANLQNRRKLLPEDVAQVCSSREQFLFLREDVRDLIREQSRQHKQQKQNKSAATQPVVTNSKPLTAYFGKK